MLAAALALQPATFHRDIAPILFRYCAPCHHSGGAGPFPLVTYDDARKHARQIAAATARRYMPPWLPQPGFGEFAEERRLSRQQIQTIADWVRAGAPQGVASDAPPPPTFTPGWSLGPPDLVLTTAKPFTIPADGPDVFWNFILSPGLRETRYVQAIEIRPGNARSVHHANLLVDRSRSERDRERVAGEGFPGMDLTIGSDTFDPDSHFLFWKPGSAPSREPIAWRLDPGNDLVLNLHLQPAGKPESIQPSVGLYFTRRALARFPMLVQLEHDGALDIPPGDRDFVVADDFRLPLDVDVLAVYPHAHYLGKLLEGYATLPGGERRWLIRIPDWDLNWQAVYRYRQPVFLPQGTVISMRFHYDNSAANPRNPNAPPRRVRGGNQAADEMGHLWLQVLPRGGGDQRMPLQEALMVHRLEKYPADFSADFNLGALYLRRQDAASALPYLRAALRARPDQPAVLNMLGVALEMQGDHEQAAQQFRGVLRLRPGDASAEYNLANALAAEGQFEAAAEAFRRALAANPGDRNARDRLAQTLKAIGDAAAGEARLPAALAAYRELVAMAPGNADYRNNFGILLARSGDLAAAVTEFEAALRIDPRHAAARRNLEVARKKMPH